MTLTQFIRENRAEIDAAIKRVCDGTGTRNCIWSRCKPICKTTGRCDVGDRESMEEDARQEVAYDRAIRDGRIMHCHHCGDQDWVTWIEVYAYPAEPVPLCRDCAKAHEARY